MITKVTMKNGSKMQSLTRNLRECITPDLTPRNSPSFYWKNKEASGEDLRINADYTASVVKLVICYHEAHQGERTS